MMLLEIDDLLRVMIEQEASDLHIKAGSPPGLRIHGELLPLEDTPPLTPDDTDRLINSIMQDHQKSRFAENKELDSLPVNLTHFIIRTKIKSLKQ